MSSGISKVGQMYSQPSNEFQAERSVAKAQQQIDRGSPYTPKPPPAQPQFEMPPVQSARSSPAAPAAPSVIMKMPGSQQTKRGGGGGGGGGRSPKGLSAQQFLPVIEDDAGGTWSGVTPSTPSASHGLPAAPVAHPMPAARPKAAARVARPMGSGPIIDV